MVVGGADKVNIDIISNLDRNIFSIHIVTTSDEENIWLSRFEPISDNIFQLPNLFEEKYRLKFILFLIKELKINLVFLSNSFVGYSSLPQIKRLDKKIKVVDLMHGEGGKHEGGGAPLFSSKYDQFIDCRVVISNYLREYIISKFNINPEKIEVITNGINTDYFNKSSLNKNSLRQEFNIKESDIVISYVGRLDIEKHPENVILLADYLKNRGYFNYKFIVSGNGTQYNALKLLVEKLKVEDIVIFLGYKEDVRPVLTDTDILFLCSETEGIPLVILEAMAMKIPVISSNVGGVPELIEENINGFLVNFDEYFIENCAEKIVTLSKKEMEEIGENNREKACTLFSLNTMAENYNRLFYKLIFSNDKEE
jgi:glycosyltransferase involved in cell wall biosynthesis